MVRAPLAARAAALALGSMLAACASPTLPLPPPSDPDVSQSVDGLVTLSSTNGVEPYAIVVITNDDPSIDVADRASATEADANGSWTKTVKAVHGDVLEITQQVESTTSTPLAVDVN